MYCVLPPCLGQKSEEMPSIWYLVLSNGILMDFVGNPRKKCPKSRNLFVKNHRKKFVKNAPQTWNNLEVSKLTKQPPQKKKGRKCMEISG